MDIRDLILSNFRRKLFALLLAVLVWFTVHFVESKRPAPAANAAFTNVPAFTP